MKHVQYESLGTQHNDGMRLTDSLTIEHDCTSKHMQPLQCSPYQCRQSLLPPVALKMIKQQQDTYVRWPNI